MSLVAVVSSDGHGQAKEPRSSRVVGNSYSTVSVVIPVYNGGWRFRRCLGALENCRPGPLEIIVVADGRDAGWLPDEREGLRTIVLETRGGPGQARNSGAAAASGDILLFIDADVVVKEDIIERIQTIFAGDEGLAAVFGSYDDTPFEPDPISQYRNLLHHFTHQNACPDASTFWGACGAIRRAVFMKAGGFDPLYREPSVEDIELGYRLKEKGCRIRLQKDLQVTHLKRWTLASMVRTDIRCRAIPWTELLLRRERIAPDLNLSVMARVSTILVFLLLVASLSAPFSPGLFWPALLCSILLFGINHEFYRFLARKRGLPFLLRVLPLHWLYFLYSGLSFLFVFSRVHFWRRLIGCRGRLRPFPS